MMSWRRGFFRLWVLAALLWAGFVTLLAWNYVASPYVPAKAVLFYAGEDKPRIIDQYGSPYRELDDGATQGQVVKTALTDRHVLFTQKTTPDASRALLIIRAREAVAAYDAAEASTRRYQSLFVAALTVVIPATFVLLLGAGIGWAISGFRRTP